MGQLIDPRDGPTPPYSGHPRRLAQTKQDLEELLRACRAGRIYDVEAWISAARPLQLDPSGHHTRDRRLSPLHVALERGNYDLVCLLLCNGYRLDLEPRSPLDTALEEDRQDLVDLLLQWGADAAAADPHLVLDSYDRSLMDRFFAAGADLTRDGAMTEELSSATRNRPLYGFVKNARHRDLHIQDALDRALGIAVADPNDKAISLCLWAGADPRSPAGETGMTAFERAVFEGTPQYLKKLGFNPASDAIQPLYERAWRPHTVAALLEIAPPEDWHAITADFVQRLGMSLRHDIPLGDLADLEAILRLGGRLDDLDRDLKRELRYLLLTLGDYEARRLFRTLRKPENLAPAAFVALCAHEKLLNRYMHWEPTDGVTKDLLSDLAAANRAPGAVKRWARSELARRQRPKPSTPRKPRRPRERPQQSDDESLSRTELYELVWSEPITKVARRLGLSDNGVRKRCRAMAVPTPPRGYWQKRPTTGPPPLPPLKE